MAHGEINISAQIRDTYFDNKQGAILKYSRNTDEIGITPASMDHTNSYSVKGDDPTIKCTSYLKEYGLIREEATRHPITVEDGTIWVDTTTTI
jgi:hypothetical protein